MAILHDFLEVPGGGERTVLTLAKALNAPIFTASLNPEVPRALGMEATGIVPFKRIPKRYPWRQIAASIRFHQMNLEGFDVYVLSGNWAHFAAAGNRPNLFYCHTPPRFFYDLKERFLGYLPRWKRPLARSWIWAHSKWDCRSVRSVDTIVTNSQNVRRRVAKYYRREALVIYPPVPTKRYRFDRVGDFWLSVNRLYPEKRIELQMEIFRRLPNERLVIVGDAPLGDHSEGYVNSIEKPPNVELLGRVDEEKLLELYATCRGLIATAVDEDFGMTPVEAMAAGKATLAVDEGGFRETVQRGATGILLPPSPQAFADTIRRLDTRTLEAMRAVCQEAAKAFDEEIFLQKMEVEISKLAGHRRGS